MDAHFQQVLETDDEILPDEDLNSPPFDLEELGFESDTTIAPGNGFIVSSLVHNRRKRVVEELEPTQCSMFDYINRYI